MDRERAARVLAIFEARGEVDALESAGPSAASVGLARAQERLAAATLLIGAGHWESAFTTAYDAFRMAADSVVLALGYRVPAVRGAHRITIDIAQAALGSAGDAFSGAAAERFRIARHEAEYFDPDRPTEKSEGDARWAVARASAAISAVTSALDSS